MLSVSWPGWGAMGNKNAQRGKALPHVTTPWGIILLISHVESICVSIWMVALKENSTDYDVNGAPWSCADALMELGGMMENLENHTSFPSRMSDIVIERAWNSASDVQSSSPKSVWSQSLRVSCFFSLKGKCRTRSFLIFSSWKAFGSSDMEESGKPWKICELWWHGEHDYLGNTGVEDGWVWERPRRGKNHRKGLPVI